MSDAPYTLYVEARNHVISQFVVDINAAREAAVRDTSTLRQSRAIAEQIALQLEKVFPLSQARSREVVEALETMLKFMNQLSGGYFAGLVLRVPGIIEGKAGSSAPVSTGATNSEDVQKQVKKLEQDYNRQLKAQENRYRTLVEQAQNDLLAAQQRLAQEQVNQQQMQKLNQQLQDADKALQDARDEQQVAQQQLVTASDMLIQMKQQLQTANQEARDAQDHYQQILPQLQSLTQRVSESEQGFQDMKSERDALVQQQSDLKIRYEILEERHKQSQDHLLNITTAEQIARERADTLSENNESLGKQLEQLEQQVKEMEQEIDRLSNPLKTAPGGTKSSRKGIDWQ